MHLCTAAIINSSSRLKRWQQVADWIHEDETISVLFWFVLVLSTEYIDVSVARTQHDSNVHFSLYVHSFSQLIILLCFLSNTCEDTECFAMTSFFFPPSCHSFTVTSTHCVIHIAITSGFEAPLCTIEEGIAVFVCLVVLYSRFAKPICLKGFYFLYWCNTVSLFDPLARWGKSTKKKTCIGGKRKPQREPQCHMQWMPHVIQHHRKTEMSPYVQSPVWVQKSRRMRVWEEEPDQEEPISGLTLSGDMVETRQPDAHGEAPAPLDNR